jgi:hypothetical protein
VCLFAASAVVLALPVRAATNMSFGITVGATLPEKAAAVKVGKDTFFVYHGSFYRQLKVGYVLVPAPLGATIKALPRGAVQFKLGKVTYYQHAGVYFKGVGRNFQVCAAPADAPAETANPDAREAHLALEFGEDTYLFRRGRFFLESPDGLLGRTTPVGAIARDFPPDAMSVWFRDSEYFESGGVFFKEVAGGFQVVQPPWVNSNAVPADALAQAGASN